MITQIAINQIQKEIIQAISELTIKRENENNNNKKININAFSISKHIKRDYKTVKTHLKKLKELVCS